MSGTYCVYKHTSPSGKVYIGTTKRSTNQRWRNGLGYKGNPYFYKAICKYGWDNITHEIILENLSYQAAANAEVRLIASHNSTNRHSGYNIQNGGNMCGTHSEETKRKISIANMGNKRCEGRKLSEWHIQQLRNSNLGTHKGLGGKRSAEQRANISKALTGKKKSAEHIQRLIESHPDVSGPNNPMYGKQHSEHTKMLISKKAKARPVTETQKEHLRNIAKKRAVEQMDFDGNVIATFAKVIDAANSVSAFPQNIGAVCRGVIKSCKGYTWRYCDENRR